MQVINERVQYYTPEGQLVTEDLRDFTRKNVRNQFASLTDFLTYWRAADKKQAILDELEERGVLLHELQQEVEGDLDPFDLICHVAFDKEALTRSERARKVRQDEYFDRYGDEARAVLEALLAKYADEGIENIERMDVLKVHPLNEMGSPLEIVNRFGGKQAYQDAVRSMEQRLYDAA